MVPYCGDFAEDDTVDIVFNAFTSNDPSASATITNFVNTDVHIHKDLGVSQRNNAAGITVTVDFDGITGNHAIKIDTSDDTVGGFWVTGSEYQVRIEGTTVDGATVNAWVGTFSIERAGGTVALLKLIQAAVITNAAGADVAADIIAMKAETATIVNDTDVIDDGTSGLVKIASDVAAILVDTAVIGALGAGLTAITDKTDNLPADPADDSDIDTQLAAIKAETALIVADTNELQTDNIPATLATIAGYIDAEVAAILTDTGELQTDLADGGRLDLLIDAIKAKTDNLPADPADDSDIDTQLAAIKAETALIVADTNELQTDNTPAAIAALNNLSSANVETAVDAAFENAIPGAPTADSINDYLQTLKYCLVNKMVITEATGNTVIYEDDDATPHCTVAVAFDSDGTDTTRKKLE